LIGNCYLASPRKGFGGTGGASGSPDVGKLNKEELMSEGRQGATVEVLLLRADEAAIVLGIGRTKVFEMLASGELPAIRIGRCVRVPKDRLEKWIDDQANAHAQGFHMTDSRQRGLTTGGRRITFSPKR
jgi:excisionase family DNA binding protein